MGQREVFPLSQQVGPPATDILAAIGAALNDVMRLTGLTAQEVIPPPAATPLLSTG